MVLGFRRRAVIGALVLVALVAPTAVHQARASAPAADAPLVWGDFVPPMPGDIVVRQPDGSSFKAALTPAEIGGDLEAEGYTVTKRTDGWWVYADGRDGTELRETPARVGLDAVPAGVAIGAGRTKNLWLDASGNDLRSQAFRQLQQAAWTASMQAAAAGDGPRVFRFPVLMLATWWDEEAGQTEPQFQDGSTPDAFKAMLDGFGGNDTGTLTEFYFENSYGQFLVQVDVFGPYTSVRSMEDRCYYGGSDVPADPLDDLDAIDSALGIGGGGAIGMAVEAVPQADADVDFSQYDNDGDGFVDFTAILHSGPDMAATGDPCHTWSHAIQAGVAGEIVEDAIGLPHNTLHHGIPTSDGVIVDRLFTMPEVDLEIGVATHEMAHALGEPDYYNPSYTSMGTGDWDIMAGGSWLGNPPGSNPTGFSPASRVFQGWITPTVVTADRTDVTLAPHELQPFPGYVATKPHPNVLLVPVTTIAVGETDDTEHTWTEEDVYGLPKAGERYVVEGYYLENWSRSVTAPPFDARMKRQPYFDRAAHGSGLMVWHFDYVRRSNVLYGGNTAGAEANRPQMDPVEFDFNDNTQELQLALTRGEPQDLITSAATGITSGTRRPRPGIPSVAGTPQADSAWTGVVPPTQHEDHPFTVEDNPANYELRVSVAGTGDCTLQLLHEGEPVGGTVDAGFVADAEVITITEPEPGEWTARVGDFAACTAYDGTIELSKPNEVFDTMGAGDTWSSWSEKPTGWAFTNVRGGGAQGIVTALDGGSGAITLDVLKLAGGAVDLSAGFVTPGNLDAGVRNTLSVPVFNNGDVPVGAVGVTVRAGSASGPVVARGSVPSVAPYSRTEFPFTYTPSREGPVALYATVDPANSIGERSEANNGQRAVLDVSPAGARVLVVDDDGAHTGEESVTGALAVLGVPFDVVDEHVTVDVMRRYQAVVWEGGQERYQGQLDESDRAAVTAYLDGGGRLLYASPRAAAALGEPAGSTNPLQAEDAPQVLADYFGVAYRDTLQVGGGRVTGTGDILGGDGFLLGVSPGRPLQDVFEEVDSEKGASHPIASFERGGEGSLMGTRVEGDTAHGSFRSVFLGFNPAQVLSADAAVQVLERSLGWLGVAPGSYGKTAAVIRHVAVRNGVVGQKVEVIAFATGTSATPVLSYRVHGDPRLVSVPMTRGQRAGTYQATIPGSAVTVLGVDYLVSVGPARHPMTSDLSHFISVGLPL